MYSLPSTSQMCAPLPRAKNDGIRARREQQRCLMSIDAAGDDFLRAFEQGFTVGELIGLHDEILACAIARTMMRILRWRTS